MSPQQQAKTRRNAMRFTVRVRPVAGDIGAPIRHIELEPLEAPSRREAPAAPVPAPQPESVPA